MGSEDDDQGPGPSDRRPPPPPRDECDSTYNRDRQMELYNEEVQFRMMGLHRLGQSPQIAYQPSLVVVCTTNAGETLFAMLPVLTGEDMERQISGYPHLSCLLSGLILNTAGYIPGM